MNVRIPIKKQAQIKSEYKTKDKFTKSLIDIGFVPLSSDKVSILVRKCLPTGIPALDVISARDKDGVWGLPFGKQVEFSGKPDSGKTSMLIAIAVAAQKQNCDVVWIETEHSLNRKRASDQGADIDKFLLDTPENLEEALIKIRKAVKSLPRFDEEGFDSKRNLVILFDSIAATPTLAEVEKEEADQQIALFARRMAHFQRKMLKALGTRNALIIYSNQLKDKIGVMFGKKTQTYGGNAIRFHCGLRYEMTYTGKMKGTGGEIEGVTVNIENVKNKCFIPFKKIEGLELKFGKGFNYAQSLLLALEEKKLAKKTGLKYKIFPMGKDFEIKKSDFEEMIKREPQIGIDLERVLNVV